MITRKHTGPTAILRPPGVRHITGVQSSGLTQRPVADTGVSQKVPTQRVPSLPNHLPRGVHTHMEMTSAQATARNADEFRNAFRILTAASIGVVLCRTREPYRAIDTLREFAHADKVNFKSWTIASGWANYDKADIAADPTYMPGSNEPVMALRAIMPTDGADTFGAGIFVMMNPHKPISQNIVMVQIIKDYARAFPETRKRLIIITPPGWSLPQELEDDVIILDFDPPAYAELVDAYNRVLTALPADKRPRFSNENVQRIIAAGTGMTAHEFESAVARAGITLRAKLPDVTVDEFSSLILGVKTEVVRRSEVLEVMSAGSIENIGGLENLKLWIRKRAGCFSQEARDFGVDAIKGIALIGPPGTGKTASAKAIASVLGLPLLKFDVSRIFNSLVGESEARVRNALKLVDSMAPCVLLMDEVDKAFQRSSGGDSGVGQRVLGAVLTWMQETKAAVFTVVTANRVDNLPSEFLRRGRLDEVFSVTVPHADERRAILDIHLRLRKQDPEAIEGMGDAVAGSEGFVAAELEAAVKDAVIEAYSTGVPVTGGLIAQQIANMVPISEAFKADFEAMQSWAEKNARPASLPQGATTEQPRARIRSRVTDRPAGRQINIGAVN